MAELRTNEHGVPVLEVENLCKSFRSTVALDNVSFTTPKGSFVVVLGPAGAGKTTTLRTIAGLDRQDSGTVRICGQDMAGWEPKDRNISMILDNLALYPNKSGYMNIASPLIIRKEPKDQIDERVHKIATTLKVTRLLDRKPGTMSGGERQRIALGRALIRTPNLFLLDEPLSSLDAQLRIELRAELKRLQRELGYTFLMATPDFTEAMAIADTVIMLREGRVVQTGHPQDIYNQPLDRETAQFVGSPLINIIDATYVANGNGGNIAAAGTKLPIPAQLKNTIAQNAEPFQLGIRPENLVITNQDAADIKGELIDVEALGLKSVLTVRNDAAELRLLVESTETKDLETGQNIGLAAINTKLQLAFDKQSGKRLQ